MSEHEHQCDQCGQFYDSEFRLKNHIKRRHKKRQKLGGEHICCWCGDEFDSPTWLSNHLEEEHGKEYHRLNSGVCYMKRYKRVLEDIPDKYRTAFDELTGEGRSLLSVQAAISYIESTATMSEVGEAFATSDVTVRDVTRELIDRGVIEVDDVTSHGRPFQEFEERRADQPTKWKPEA